MIFFFFYFASLSLVPVKLLRLFFVFLVCRINQVITLCYWSPGRDILQREKAAERKQDLHFTPISSLLPRATDLKLVVYNLVFFILDTIKTSLQDEKHPLMKLSFLCVTIHFRHVLYTECQTILSEACVP